MMVPFNITSCLATAHHLLEKSMIGMPAETWWLAALVLLVLGAAALIDSFTATVPDVLIFLGLASLLTVQGLEVSWPFASHNLMLAIATGMIIWGINHIWYMIFKYDAIGMGDAKWTMLAAGCFGIPPVVFAWGLGAILAILWMGVVRLFNYRVTRVTFAPFLFIGLVMGIDWFRF